jgi:ribosomal protein S18 acetylase RimI-like enzyme
MDGEQLPKRSSKVILRPLKAKELASLITLWKEAGLPSRPRGRDSLSNLRRQRLRDPELFVGAFIGSRLVGAAIASDDGRKGWINRLAVAPGARRRGIATLLTRHCEDILRSRGRPLFCALIEAYNHESMKLFEHLGYCKEEDIFYYTKREDAQF